MKLTNRKEHWNNFALIFDKLDIVRAFVQNDMTISNEVLSAWRKDCDDLVEMIEEVQYSIVHECNLSNKTGDGK